MATDVTVPTLGESITEATLGQWLKKPGDAVNLEFDLLAKHVQKLFKRMSFTV